MRNDLPWLAALAGIALSSWGGAAVKAEAPFVHVVDGNRLVITTSSITMRRPNDTWEFQVDSMDVGELAVLAARGTDTRITIQSQALPGMSLAAIVPSIDFSLEQQLEEWKTVSSGDAGVGCLEAYRVDGETREDGRPRKIRFVFFKLNDNLYTVRLNGAPAEFDRVLEDFDTLLSSIEVRTSQEAPGGSCMPAPDDASEGSDAAPAAQAEAASVSRVQVELTSLGDSLAPLQRRFNEDVDQPRLVALLSPTCSGCAHAARGISAVLAEFPEADIRAIVVWFPMLPGDSEGTAIKAARQFADRRVRQFYDPNLLSGTAYAVEVFPDWVSDAYGAVNEGHMLRSALESAVDRSPEAPLWDVAFFYARGTKWTDGIPRPAHLIKQFAFHGRNLNGPTGYFTIDDFKEPIIDSDWHIELRRRFKALLGQSD